MKYCELTFSRQKRTLTNVLGEGIRCQETYRNRGDGDRR